MTDFYSAFDGSHDPLKDRSVDPSKFAPKNNWFFSEESKLLKKGKKLEHDDFWVLRRWNWVSFLHRSDRSTLNLPGLIEPKRSVVYGPTMPSINSVLWKQFRGQIFYLLFLQLLSALFSFAIPVLVPFMVEYVENRGISEWLGYVYAGVVVLSTLAASIFYYKSQWLASMLGLRVRAVLMAAVYEKVLTANSTMKTVQGQVANLFANDSSYIFNGSIFLAPGMIAPVQFLAVTVLLYFQVGLACFISFGVMFILVLAGNILLSKRIGNIRIKLQQAADGRLRLSQEMMRGIKIVKYYAWEEPLLASIDAARRKELGYVRSASWARVWVLFITTISGPLIIAVTFVVYEQAMGLHLNTSIAFTTLALINMLRAPSSLMAGMFPVLFNVKASLRRFDNFLRAPNREDYVNRFRDKVFVDIKNASFAWEDDGGVKTLDDITIRMNQGDKVMVVGGVGAGKSSLALTLLGEIPKLSGSVAVGGSVAYVPQQAWTFSGTLRENILFGKPYDKARFDAAVSAACLDVDLKLLPDGDMTVIGERGVNLSGGQRQRISIARGLYQNCDIYVLDDPFSALDPAVMKRVFRKTMQSFLKNKTVFLTTNDLNLVRTASEILYLFKGRITGRGTFDHLYDNHIPFKTLCKSYGADKKIYTQQKRLARIMRHSSQLQFSPRSDSDESVLTPRLSTSRSGRSSHALSLPSSTSPSSDASAKSSPGASPRVVPSLSLMDLPSMEGDDGISSARSGTNSSMWAAKLAAANLRNASKQASGYVKGSGDSDSLSDNEISVIHAQAMAVKPEERARGLISWSLINFYLKQGGLVAFSVVIIFFILMATAKVGGAWWLGEWSRDLKLLDTQNTTTRTEFWVSTYSAWLLAEILATFLAMVSCLVVFAFVASKALHRRLISKLAYSISHFFDVTPIGRITTRLSTDMGLIDYLLPVVLANYLYYLFQILASLGAIGLGTWYVLVALVPLIGIFFALNRYFSKTNIEVQRLEAIARAPSLSHLSSTILGIESIRAYQHEGRFVAMSNDAIDYDSTAKYALKYGQMWYGLRMEFISAVGILFVFFGVALARNYLGIDSGFAGIAMSSTSGLTLLLAAWSMRAAEFEVWMNSIERFADFDRNELEEDEEAERRKGRLVQLTQGWPNGGSIEFKHFTYQYRTGPPVLHDISVIIPSQAKVGIVGRTGAGKSSVFEALLRMENPAAGLLLIDGVDVRTIPLHTLRSAISVIPQNPVLFSGTLRSNLDPYNQHTDQELWDVLSMTSLKIVVSSIDGRLDCVVTENGENFSVGQRQLICIARAVLRATPIVLLDEPTASVDVLTDMLVKKLVKECFAKCTVLTISHRLTSVMDSDLIMVLEKGYLVEYDKPSNLLAQKSGYLKAMVAELSLEAVKQVYQLAGSNLPAETADLAGMTSKELVSKYGKQMSDLTPRVSIQVSVGPPQVVELIHEVSSIDLESSSSSSNLVSESSRDEATDAKAVESIKRNIKERVTTTPVMSGSGLGKRPTEPVSLDDSSSVSAIPLSPSAPLVSSSSGSSSASRSHSSWESDEESSSSRSSEASVASD